VVKESVSRFAANSLHPDAACALIEQSAFSAVTNLASARPVAITTPITMTLDLRTSDYADLAARVAGVRRTGTLSCEIALDDPLELYKTFITVVLLCRGLTE
jgi:D-amino peptidase